MGGTGDDGITLDPGAFREPDKALLAVERIGARAIRPVAALVETMFGHRPTADEGLARFERLLDAQSPAGPVIDALLDEPRLARVLAAVLLASRHLSDVVAQNPELLQTLLDPQQLAEKPTVESVIDEGSRYLSKATSYSHKLDRLRYLKQKSWLQLAAADLGGLFDPRSVWEGLSDTAVGLLTLARQEVWEHVRQRHDGPEICPVSVIAFGKLGGRELNYSSDVDLAFVLEDAAGPDDETLARKFCESFRSATSDRMGRGDLFRVDLRLRPFGSTGPIVNREAAVRNYYANYAEPWEHLALVRSVCIGGLNHVAFWEDLREKTVFSGARSQMAIEGIQRMKMRSEELGGPDDLKRGAGGIRDIELLVQTIQMLAGHTDPRLHVKGTLDALDALRETGRLSSKISHVLAESYQFLRQVEHRCQIIDSSQTHRLPDDELDREAVASSLGMRSVNTLENRIDHVRTSVKICLTQTGWTKPNSQSGRASEGVASWIEALPGENRFFSSLQENEGSLQRAERLVDLAPALLPALRQSVVLTEQVFSGEVLEPAITETRFALADKSPASLADSVRRGWLTACVRHVLLEEADTGIELANNLDRTIEALFGDHPQLTVIALGSYGSQECFPASDADILVFRSDDLDQAAADNVLRDILARVRSARSLGAPVGIDLRLRPEGRSGRLATSREAFALYRRRFMEPWERFALGQARLVRGEESCLDDCRQAAYGQPLSDQELDDLLQMKGRIEHERVAPLVRPRHLKLGPGGIDDLQWLCRLSIMRHPWVLRQAKSPRVLDCLDALVRAELLTVLERDFLRQAWIFFQQLRTKMFLVGAPDDVVPENPDKLDRLARGLGLTVANDVLARHEEYRNGVRASFDEAIQRLRR